MNMHSATPIEQLTNPALREFDGLIDTAPVSLLVWTKSKKAVYPFPRLFHGENWTDALMNRACTGKIVGETHAVY
jgi:hypothetical protein